MVHPFLRAGIALAAAIAGVVILGGIEPTQPAVALTAASKSLSKAAPASGCTGCEAGPFRMRPSDLAPRPLPASAAKAASRVPAVPAR